MSVLHESSLDDAAPYGANSSDKVFHADPNELSLKKSGGRRDDGNAETKETETPSAKEDTRTPTQKFLNDVAGLTIQDLSRIMKTELTELGCPTLKPALKTSWMKADFVTIPFETVYWCNDSESLLDNNVRSETIRKKLTGPESVEFKGVQLKLDNSMEKFAKFKLYFFAEIRGGSHFADMFCRKLNDFVYDFEINPKWDKLKMHFAQHVTSKDRFHEFLKNGLKKAVEILRDFCRPGYKTRQDWVDNSEITYDF